jgi:hypothetical protein
VGNKIHEFVLKWPLSSQPVPVVADWTKAEVVVRELIVAGTATEIEAFLTSDIVR